MTFCWLVITPYRFREACCLQLHGSPISPLFLDNPTLRFVVFTETVIGVINQGKWEGRSISCLKEEKYVEACSSRIWRRYHSKDCSVDRQIISKCILKERTRIAWSELSWLVLGTDRDILWTRWRNFPLRTIRGLFSLSFLWSVTFLRNLVHRGRPTNKKCNKITLCGNPKHKNLTWKFFR
jgi:hypothetical protein